MPEQVAFSRGVVPQYYVVPGDGRPGKNFKPGLIYPQEPKKDSFVKKVATTTGALTIVGLTAAALFKPSLLKDVWKLVKAEGAAFLTKHPNLSKGLNGFKTAALTRLNKLGTYLSTLGK